MIVLFYSVLSSVLLLVTRVGLLLLLKISFICLNVSQEFDRLVKSSFFYVYFYSSLFPLLLLGCFSLEKILLKTEKPPFA